MKRVQIVELYKYLYGKECVSVPMLMDKFDLNFKDAVRLMQSVTERGWATSCCQGVEHAICKDRLAFFRIRPDEVQKVCEDLGQDEISVLEHLITNYKATFCELERKVQGDDDTKKAIDQLESRNILSEYDGRYFLCIEGSSTKSLLQCLKKKRTEERLARRPHSETDDIDTILNTLWNSDGDLDDTIV